MMINFATCERNTALMYIQRVYPSREVTEEMCSDVLDLVEKDIIRVQDPMMYGNSIQITAGKRWVEDADERERITKACKDMVDRVTASPVIEVTE